jgi:tripartite ATP-independent transporter DctP family solute receptor
MKKVKKIFITIMVVLLSLSLIACGSTSDKNDSASETDKNDTANNGKAEKVVLNLSTPDPDGSSITESAKEFAKKVHEKSQGSIEIQVYPNGTLYGGDPSAAIKQLSAGSLDMLGLSTSLYANFEPKFNVISVPYLFDDLTQFREFLNGELGDELLESLNELGIKGLGFWTRSFRQITNSVRPITSPDDLKGLKLRVPNNPIYVDFFKETGAAPTPMAFGEVYNALQLKTIDGQENPVDVPASAKFYEVQKYLSITNHMADGWVVAINPDKFAQLSEEQQQILIDVTREMQEWKIQYDKESDNAAIETMKEKGMEVNEISAEAQQHFIGISKRLYPKFKTLVTDEDYFLRTLEFVGKAE